MISGTQLKQVLGNINPENVKITDVSLPLISTAPMQQMVQQPVDVNTLSVLMKGVLEVSFFYLSFIYLLKIFINVYLYFSESYEWDGSS